MSQALGRHRSELGPLANIYSSIQPAMADVERVLEQELRSRQHDVTQRIRYALGLGGKRLRPALLLMAAQAAGSVTRAHIVLAAVAEMIHTATLVHDDVLDEATLRRHSATVNARWDNETSVLVGDFLFTHAFYLASTLDDPFACQTIGRATNRVCDGELQQLHASGRFDLSEQEYFDIIEAKTAVLCACCCRLGAHYAGVDDATEQALDEYGRLLGLAFQITDDVLDVQGDESTAGKSLGTDFSKQKATLPLIRALATASGQRRRGMLARLRQSSDDCRGDVMAWLHETGAVQYAQSRARDLVERAQQQLEQLEESSAKDQLAHLAQFVVERSH